MDIYVYDEIDQTLSRNAAESLHESPREAVTVHINSYGGSVSDALAVYNALQAHSGPVTIYAEGVVFSAATLIACAGHCIAYKTALFGFHSPWRRTVGHAADHRDAAASLDKFTDHAAQIYAAKTGRPVAEMTALMTAQTETWLSAQEAKDMGFVNEIVDQATELRLGPITLPARFSIMPGTTPTTAAPVHMSPSAIATMCADEPAVIAGLLTQPRTEAEVRARLEEARNIRQLANLPGMASRAGFSNADIDQWIRSGVDEDGAKSKIWNALVAADQAIGEIDTTPPPRGGFGNPIPYGGHGDQFISAASDALAARMGAVPKAIHPAANDFQDTSLTGMAAYCVNASGKPTLGVSRQRLVNMAMTTSDFHSLLNVTANKSLTARFEAMAEDHRQFCESSNLPDFKPATAVNVSLLPGLVLKPEAEAIEYGSISDGSETYKLATYARGLSLSREAIINDDLQAFSSLIASAANASARLERDLVFNVLTANAAMSDTVALFHATHGNLDTSAAAIDVPGLNAARVLMRNQKDSNGGYVMTQPGFIICPVVLEGDAEALLASITYRPATNTEVSTPKWIKNLTIVSDPRLDVVSDSVWYLLSTPIVAPTIRLGYLNNVTSPTVENDKDFDTDVLKYKIRFDVVAAAVGYAGAVKMA